MNGYRPEAAIEDERLPPEREFKGTAVGEHPPTVKEFASTDEMLDFVQRTRPLWKPLKRGVHIRDWTNVGDTSGADDWQSALHLARHGWPEGRRLLIHAEGQNFHTGTARARRWNFDIAGAVPDVPRFIAGDPENMVDYLPSNHGRKPVINIRVSPMCSRDVTPERRANWGAALLSWVEAEEALGYRVDVGVVYVSSPGWVVDGRWAGKVVVKFRLQGDGMRRSVDDMAFWLMHNAAHLRIQFAVRECLDVGRFFETNPPYGNAVDRHDDIRRYLPDNEILLVLGKGAGSVDEGLAMIYADIDRHRNTIAA